LRKFGCHSNSFGSLKISDSIFNFPNPENLTICVEKVIDFCTELKSVQFLLIFAQIGCNGNSRGSLKISDSKFHFADRKNLTILVKISWIFLAEMNSVEFVPIFAQIWLPWQLPWLP